MARGAGRNGDAIADLDVARHAGFNAIFDSRALARHRRVALQADDGISRDDQLLVSLLWGRPARPAVAAPVRAQPSLCVPAPEPVPAAPPATTRSGAALVGHVRLSVGWISGARRLGLRRLRGRRLCRRLVFAGFVAGLTTASVSCTDRSAVATGASVGAGVVATTVFAEVAAGGALLAKREVTASSGRCDAANSNRRKRDVVRSHFSTVSFNRLLSAVHASAVPVKRPPSAR